MNECFKDPTHKRLSGEGLIFDMLAKNWTQLKKLSQIFEILKTGPKLDNFENLGQF